MSSDPQQAVSEFLAEAEDLLGNLNQNLTLLSEGVDTDEVNPELLNGIFRDAHSLKGLAGMFGFSDISELSHHLESLLDRLRLGKVALNRTLVDGLFDSLSDLIALVEGKSSKPEANQDISASVAAIENLLNRMEGKEKGRSERLQLPPELLSVLTEYEEHRLQENIRQGKALLLVKSVFPLDSFDVDLAALTEELKKRGEVISTLPGEAGDRPDHLAFNVLCGAECRGAELLDDLGDAAHAVDELVGLTPSAEGGEPFTGSKAQPIIPQGANSPTGAEALHAFSSTVRVDINKLDTLMDIVGDLSLLRGEIAQLGEDLSAQGAPEGKKLDKVAQRLERRLLNLQARVMDVRMVPVRQLFDKLNRIIRKMAQELGKSVELEVRGGETELDKLIVEKLADPLMHIIRNALDHGIESGPERIAAGKPEVGRILLFAAPQGNHVEIKIGDDGRGIDADQLWQEGIARGLVAPDNQICEQDAFNLLFLPGFSTRTEVSEFSGRGVGMDVVKNNISDLSGLIDISSRVGEGTTLTLTLPVTLAIIKALVIRSCGRDFAIPLAGVIETQILDPGMTTVVAGQEVLELRQQTLPLLNLGQLFGFCEEASQSETRFVVVVGHAERRVGFVVDDLHGQQDVVIKPLGKSLGFVRGICGAADLGDKRTILVLDVGELVEGFQRHGAKVNV